MRFGRVAVDLVGATCGRTATPGRRWRAASSRFSVPTALVSKSSNGIAAARSWLGCAAAWTIDVGLTARDQRRARRRDRGCRARDARSPAARAAGAAGSSGCRPAGRRTPRAGCCRRRARRSPARARSRLQTSEPIRPDDPVTRYRFHHDAGGTAAARKSASAWSSSPSAPRKPS